MTFASNSNTQSRKVAKDTSTGLTLPTTNPLKKDKDVQIEPDQQTIDLLFVIDYLEKKYLGKYQKQVVIDPKSKKAKKTRKDEMEQKATMFSKRQMELLVNFLGHIGLNDIRTLKIEFIE